MAVEPDGESAGEGTKRLYVPPTALDANALRAVAAQQTALTWLDMGLPRLAVTPQRMVVELSNGADRLRIDYDTRIAVDVLKQLGVPRPGAWSFEPERPVGKARRNVWLAGASSEVVLADEVPVPLGDLRPPNILELERHAPAHWPEPPGLARKVRYQWRNVPPVAPAPATIAQLRRDWQALDEWADGRIDVCRKASTELKKGRHFLQRLFDGATRTALATIDAGLDELAELPPSQRPIEDVPGVLAEIASQENALDALARKMHVDAEAVRAKEAEDQQRAEHDKLVQAASESARALELQMTEVGVRLEAAQAEVRRLVSLQEARQAELRQIHLAALRVEAEQRLPALTAELEEASGALHRAQGEQREAKKKSAKKDARRAVQEAERRTARLDEELARLAKAVAGEVDLADSTMSADERIVALRGQLEAAAARLATEESEKERLRGELARAQQKAQLAFDFRPPSGTAAPRPIQRKPPPPTPAESLPEKGLLLEHAGRRFLVVTTWEEARQATSDADRLKALLVIPSPEAPRR